MIAIFLLGWYVYYAMTGSWGFGIGEEKQFFGWLGLSWSSPRSGDGQHRSHRRLHVRQSGVPRYRGGHASAASGPCSSSTLNASAPDRIGTFNSTALSYFEPGRLADHDEGRLLGH